MLIVALTTAAAAHADTVADDDFRHYSVTGSNPVQQWTSEFARPLASPLQPDTVCPHVMQPPTILALLAGPVAGPLPVAPAGCNAFADRRSESASAVTEPAQESATTSTEMLWKTNSSGMEAAGNSVPSAASASLGFMSREDVGQAPSNELSTTPTDCSQVAGCEIQPEAPAAVPATASAPRPTASPRARHASATVMLSLLWLILLVLVAALAFAVGWVIRRWFRYDKRIIRAARAGLRRGEFHVEYQPVVGVRRARCVGVEALLRWDNPKYGALGPGHYMPIIESSSLIRPLTRFVMSRAAQELREIGLPRSLYLGVSAPSSYLLGSGFVADLDEAGAAGLPPLMLKIAVSSVHKLRKRLIPMMTLARQKDVRFALSGVSPKDREFKLPPGMSFEMVKVDREVLGLDPNERADQLNALTNMGHDLDAVVVIEGVENMAHHNLARASGAEFGQGFFYSRALGAIRLKDFLDTINAPRSRTAGAATVLGWRVRKY